MLCNDALASKEAFEQFQSEVAHFFNQYKQLRNPTTVKAVEVNPNLPTNIVDTTIALTLYKITVENKFTPRYNMNTWLWRSLTKLHIGVPIVPGEPFETTSRWYFTTVSVPYLLTPSQYEQLHKGTVSYDEIAVIGRNYCLHGVNGKLSVDEYDIPQQTYIAPILLAYQPTVWVPEALFTLFTNNLAPGTLDSDIETRMHTIFGRVLKVLDGYRNSLIKIQQALNAGLGVPYPHRDGTVTAVENGTVILDNGDTYFWDGAPYGPIVNVGDNVTTNDPLWPELVQIEDDEAGNITLRAARSGMELTLTRAYAILSGKQYPKPEVVVV